MAKNDLFDFSGGFTIGNPNKAFESLKKEMSFQLQDGESDTITQSNRFTAPQFVVPQDTMTFGQKLLHAPVDFFQGLFTGFEKSLGSASRFVSAGLKNTIEQRKVLKEEASKLIDKDKIGFMAKNGLIGADPTSVQQFIADQLDNIAKGTDIILNNHKDLLTNPRFNNRPFLENIKDPEYLAEGVGALIPNILTTVSLAVGTARLTRNPVAVGTVLYGTSYALEGGQSFDDAKNFGLSDVEAHRVANWAAIPNAALDVLLPFKVVGNLADPIKKSVTKKLINAFIINPAIESSTETMQQVISNAVRQSYDENASLLNNLAENAFFGAIGGVVGGGIELGGTKIKMDKIRLGLSIEEVEDNNKEVKRLMNINGEAGVSETLNKYDFTRTTVPTNKITGGNLGAGENAAVTEWETKIKAGDSTPLVVLPSDDNFEVIDGMHKLQAYKNLGINEVPVFVGMEKTRTTISKNSLTQDISKAKASGQSFDEWVKGQGNVLYRATDSKSGYAELGSGIYGADKPEFAKLFGKNIEELVVDPKAKIITEGSPEFESLYRTVTPRGDYKMNPELARKTALARGIDGIKGLDPDTGTVIFNDKMFKTRSQLKAEWDKASLTRVAKPTAKDRKFGVAPPKAKIISKPEDVLLRERFKQQARGARLGYKAGALEERQAITTQLKNTFEAKLTAIERAQELEDLKRGILTRNQQNIKEQIVKYAKGNLPPASRGKFLTMVARAKTQKNLIKAFIRINTEVDNIAKRSLIKDLKKDIERVTNSQNIAVDVKKRILALFRGIDLTKRTKATLASLKATKDYIERAKAQGEDVAMPERILDKLQLLAQKPAIDMTLQELAALRDDLLLLEQLGETKLSARIEIYKAEKEGRTERINENVTPINIKDLEKKPIGESLKAGQVAANKFKTAFNLVSEKQLMLTPMDGIAEIMGMEETKARHDLNYNNMLEFMRPHLDERAEIIERNKLDKNNVERAGVVALSKQEGGLEKLAVQDITEEQVNELEKSLTDGEQEFSDFVRREFDSFYPAVKEFARVNYNVDVGQIDNYVSFQTDYEAMSDIPVYERFGGLADNAIAMRRKNVQKGFIEERKGPGKQKIVIDLDRIYLRHLRNVSYMLNMGRDIKMDAEVIRSPEVGEKMGNLGQLIWSEWLDLMARDGGSRASVIPMIDFMRKNTTGAILAYRLSSALLQTTAIVNGASEIGGSYAVEGSYKMATSREWRQFIRENFHEIMATVGDDPAFVDLGEGWISKSTRIGITPLVKLDMLTRSSVAIGAYVKYMNENDLEIDLSNPNKDAIQAAQKTVRKTQGSSLAKDQPLAITSGALTSRGLSLAKGEPTLVGNKSIDKMTTALQSFVLANWNNIVSNVWRQGLKKGDYKKAASGVMWLLIIAPLMEMGIRGASKAIIGLITGLDDDDKKEDKDILLELAKEDLQRVPVIGPILNSMTYGSNPIPLIQLTGRGFQGVQRVVTGKKPETKQRGVVDVAAGIGGPLLGVPVQFTDIIRDLLKSTGAEELETTIGGGFDFGGSIEIGGGFDFGSGLKIGGL